MRVPSPPNFDFQISLTYTAPGMYSKEPNASMKKLAEILGGQLEVLRGVAIPTPMDGFTFYYDVYAEDCVATTFAGLDYGHSWFVELRASSQERLLEIIKSTKMAFGPENILGETTKTSPVRGYSY